MIARTSRIRRGAAAAALLALAAACADVGAPVDPAAGVDSDSLARSASSSIPQIVLDAENVIDRIAFRGTRTSRVHVRTGDLGKARVDPTSETYEIEETLASDGAGHFTIELESVTSLPSGVDPLLFPTQHERGVDAQWRLREFRIRNVDSLYGSYSVSLQGPGDVVAGIQCERVGLSRFNGFDERPGRYVLEIDPSTGFVLAMSELDEVGGILEEFTYQTFEVDPDLSGLTLRDTVFTGTTLDVAQPLEPQVGTLTLVPNLWPDGFDLERGKSFAVPQSIQDTGASLLPAGQWVRMVATDGVEVVAFAHRTMAALQTMPLAPATLQVLDEGGWTIAFGEVRGIPIIVSGRVGPSDLRLIVESAF